MRLHSTPDLTASNKSGKMDGCIVREKTKVVVGERVAVALLNLTRWFGVLLVDSHCGFWVPSKLTLN